MQTQHEADPLHRNSTLLPHCCLHCWRGTRYGAKLWIAIKLYFIVYLIVSCDGSVSIDIALLTLQALFINMRDVFFDCYKLLLTYFAYKQRAWKHDYLGWGWLTFCPSTTPFGVSLPMNISCLQYSYERLLEIEVKICHEWRDVINFAEYYVILITTTFQDFINLRVYSINYLCYIMYHDFYSI